MDPEEFNYVRPVCLQHLACGLAVCATLLAAHTSPLSAAQPSPLGSPAKGRKPAAGSVTKDSKPAPAVNAPPGGNEAAGKKAPSRKAGAVDLITNMDRAVAYIGRAEVKARSTDKYLRSQKSLAFKQELAATGRLVRELQKQVAAKDNAAHVTARKLEQTIAALDTAFRFSGVTAKEVVEGVKKLKAAWALYDSTFERQALLEKDPGGATKPLDPKQLAEMAALKAKTEGLVQLLLSLQTRLAQNKGVGYELTHLVAEARSLRNAKANFGSLQGFLERLLEIAGKYRGLHSYVLLAYPSLAKEFGTINAYWIDFDAEIARYHDELYVSYDVTNFERTQVELTPEAVEVEISAEEVIKFETYVQTSVGKETSEPYSEKQAEIDDVTVDVGKPHVDLAADGAPNDATSMRPVEKDK